MKQGVDYDLIEYGEDQWAFLYDGVQFLVDDIRFEEYIGDDGEELCTAKIQYTVISDKKPFDVEEFDAVVGDIVENSIESELAKKIEEDDIEK